MKRTISIALMLISIFFFFACTSTKNLPATSSEQPAINSGLQDGSSFENAIVVNSIKAEYEWLAKNYPGYTMKMQALSQNKKKPYDILYIVTADGVEKSIYFDISKFFGKY
jgi:hypothetical protein